MSIDASIDKQRPVNWLFYGLKNINSIYFDFSYTLAISLQQQRIPFIANHQV